MQSGESNPILAFLPLLLIFGVFYFLIIRPQQKKEKDRQQMLKDLKKGDRVVTSGGIMGTVMHVKDDAVVLRVGGEGETKIEFLKSAVTSLMGQEKG